MAVENPLACRFILKPSMSGQECNCFKVSYLPHPKFGTRSQFYIAPVTDSVRPGRDTIYEVLKYEENCRSWFFDNRVVSDGSLYVCSLVDPNFIILPILMQNKRFLPFDHIFINSEYPSLMDLKNCVSQSSLESIADCKELLDQTKAYRYNEEKCFHWLKSKINLLISLLINNKVVNSSILVDEPSLLRLAWGILSDYLTPELSLLLKAYMNVQEPVIKRGLEMEVDSAAKRSCVGEPNEDYSAENTLCSINANSVKLNSAQRQLRSASKKCMSIKSFFAAKPK